jgi:MFS family permease
MQAVNVYLPLYAYQEVGLPLATAALTAAVVGGAGLLARIGWGHAAARARSTRMPLLFLGGLAAVGTATVLLGGLVHSSGPMWAGVAIFGASGIAANVVLMVGLVREVPSATVGRATGVLAMGLYLGFALGPLGFGALVDATRSYTVGWAAVTGAYVLSACLILLARNRIGSTAADPALASQHAPLRP